MAFVWVTPNRDTFRRVALALRGESRGVADKVDAFEGLRAA